MASDKKRTSRFRTIDSHSVAGGGPEPLELVKLPTPVWIIIFALRFPFKHRVFGSFLLVALISWIYGTSFFITIGIGLTIIAISLYLYTYFKYSYAPTMWRLTQAIHRRWLVHRRWPIALKEIHFKVGRHLSRVRYTPNGMVGTFRCDQGKDSSDLASNSHRIASVLRANEVKIDATLPFEANVSIVWGDPTSRILFPEDLTGMQSSDEDRVAFALDQDQQALQISVTTSLLIVGESESGKSNCFWSLLNGLNEKNLPYKMWVIDPAGGVELSELEHSPNTLMYASRPADSDDVLARASKAMEDRLFSLKEDRIRKYVNSESSPLNIIVIDELLLLSRYDQHSSLGNILSSGRKAGFIVIALSQLSQIDALGRIRDLFPQRICHATKSREMTEAVLGSGAEDAGAYCSKITKRTPGVGYFFSSQTRLYTRFRTPLISDHNTRIISQGKLIQRTVNDDPIRTRLKQPFVRRRTSLYRYYGEYQGELGRLLYVGIAYDPKKRWAEHCNSSKERWCPHDVDPSLTEIEWFSTRQTAKAAETEAIKSEHPVYNKQERDDFDH